MITELLQLASCLALGLLIGSLLTEAIILVPYWRKMKPKEFLQLHGTLGPKLMQYFAPLTIMATVLPVVAAVAPLLLGQPSSALAWVPAALVVMMLILYFAYFKGANESFETGAVGEEGLAGELQRWANWHWVRVVLGLIAFGAALVVLSNN